MTTSHREGAQYAGAVAEAQQQLEHIPDAANWPLSERLGAFFFILLDAVEECATKEDVDHPAGAFRRSAAGWFSPFQELAYLFSIGMMRTQAPRRPSFRPRKTLD